MCLPISLPSYSGITYRHFVCKKRIFPPSGVATFGELFSGPFLCGEAGKFIESRKGFAVQIVMGPCCKVARFHSWIKSCKVCTSNAFQLFKSIFVKKYSLCHMGTLHIQLAM